MKISAMPYPPTRRYSRQVLKELQSVIDSLVHNLGLTHKMMRQFWIIQTLKDQQRQMYNEKTNRCDDRIISICQPLVRPILRGKQGKRVEFGEQLGLALADGYVKAQTIS